MESQIRPVVADNGTNRHTLWFPVSGEMKAGLMELTRTLFSEPIDLPRAEALDKIVRGLLDPIDLIQPGQVETLVDRFLHSPYIRRRLDPELIDDDWVKLKSFEEHAKWISDERQLVDFLGKDFSRQQVMTDRQGDKDSIAKAVLRKHGTFVALTDAEGRFQRLVDRAALLEKVAAGAEP